jgi:hypothetical protein
MPLPWAVWDPVFCAFSDGANRLWIVQKNERENLEIRAYTASDAVTEQTVEIDEPTLKTHDVASVCAAVLHQGNACLLVRLSNADHVLLTYDAEDGTIVAVEKDTGAWLLREYRLEKSTPA